jgi:hypothetical protein
MNNEITILWWRGLGLGGGREVPPGGGGRGGTQCAIVSAANRVLVQDAKIKSSVIYRAG